MYILDGIIWDIRLSTQWRVKQNVPPVELHLIQEEPSLVAQVMWRMELRGWPISADTLPWMGQHHSVLCGRVWADALLRLVKSEKETHAAEQAEQLEVQLDIGSTEIQLIWLWLQKLNLNSS